jgi:hypothetical protein
MQPPYFSLPLVAALISMGVPAARITAWAATTILARLRCSTQPVRQYFVFATRDLAIGDSCG